MTNVLSPLAKQKFFDNNGNPANGYKLFTYVAGTSIKLDTYPDSDTSSTNANPIILNFRGECDLWLPPNVAYKFVFAAPNDTDPPSAPIWSVDNVVDSQLVTLYGGVDTGIANAYVLNFVANFTAYQDGIVIYWIPANTNTGPSTINVNGLGPVALVNQDGSALLPGQIQANQITQILFKGTGFVVLSSLNVITSGSFQMNLSGLTAPALASFSYSRLGNIVNVQCTLGASGTSNATSFNLTSLPVEIRPALIREVVATGAVDNGGAPLSCAVQINPSGTLNMKLGVVVSSRLKYDIVGWTGSGTKGIGAEFTVAYTL